MHNTEQFFDEEYYNLYFQRRTVKHKPPVMPRTGFMLGKHWAQNRLELDSLETSVSSPATPETLKEKIREKQKENERWAKQRKYMQNIRKACEPSKSGINWFYYKLIVVETESIGTMCTQAKHSSNTERGRRHSPTSDSVAVDNFWKRGSFAWLAGFRFCFFKGALP